MIRALAPLLGDKRAEPPVLALAEDGSAVVPLLGGHRGANDLARTAAETLGIAPAITTAGDLRFGVALDAPPEGFRLGNPGDAAAFMADLLAGHTVTIKGEASYFDLLEAADGPTLAQKIAWGYETPIAEAAALAGHIAFYADQVTFEDSPQ